MLQPSTISFLKNLKKNNNKPWFDANRKLYESAKEDVSALVQEVISKLAKADPSVAHLQPKDCMFRINRDVRFSKNKDPYKTNFGASINKGGKKAMQAGYYFHIEPGAAFAGGGLYMAEPDKLKKVRQEIDYNYATFKKIITAPSFKKIYGQLSDEAEYKLSRPPKDYDATNPAIEFIKLKSWIAFRPLTDKELLSKDLPAIIVTAFKSLQPMIAFLNTALEGE